MTLLAGIFGYPIRHSISPPMHQAAFDYLGIDATYDAWETKPEDLGGGVSRLREDSYLGANVTVPHKQAVIAYIDEVDELATQIGAVNTIVKREGRLVGANTDTYGFINSLKVEADFDPCGADVVLIGAGGAARAAAFALAMESAASLTITNRTIERARDLAAEIGCAGIPTEACDLYDDALVGICRGSDLIVNSTSVGMLHGPAEGESPIPQEAISSESVVYDMVYNPAETALLQMAENAGARGVGGLPMLVYQGAASLEMWTGREAPVHVMLEAAERALGL